VILQLLQIARDSLGDPQPLASGILASGMRMQLVALRAVPRGGEPVQLQQRVRLAAVRGAVAHPVELPYDVVDVELLVLVHIVRRAVAHAAQVGIHEAPRARAHAQGALLVEPLALQWGRRGPRHPGRLGRLGRRRRVVLPPPLGRPLRLGATG